MEGPKEGHMLPWSPGDTVQKLRPLQQPWIVPNSNPAGDSVFPACLHSWPSSHTHRELVPIRCGPGGFPVPEVAVEREPRGEGQNPGYTHSPGRLAPPGQHLTRRFLRETVTSATALSSAHLSHEVGTQWAPWAARTILEAAVRWEEAARLRGGRDGQIPDGLPVPAVQPGILHERHLRHHGPGQRPDILSLRF